MARKKRRTRSRGGGTPETHRVGAAPPHGELVDRRVHVFVDDQNLFWGIVNQKYGPDFRIDFGRLLLRASRSSTGENRFVSSAYIAGVIPDDDSVFGRLWKIKALQSDGAFLGSGNCSKQYNAYLITDLTATLYEQEGPSTIVLVAGDADYVPPLSKALDKGWRNEVAFIDRGVSDALGSVVHEFRIMSPPSIEYMPY